MANKVIVKVLESNVALYIKTVVSCKTYWNKENICYFNGSYSLFYSKVFWNQNVDIFKYYFERRRFRTTFKLAYS